MKFKVTGWIESVGRVVVARVEAATALDAKTRAAEAGLEWIVVESLPPERPRIGDAFPPRLHPGRPVVTPVPQRRMPDLMPN